MPNGFHWSGVPWTSSQPRFHIPANGGPSIPAGTFHPDDQGNASVIMPDLPPGITAKGFGITIESDGGSQTPTLPVIMAGS